MRGGSLTWVGEGEWIPKDICMDWESSNYAYTCQLEKVARQENVWQMEDCKEDFPRQMCSQEV